MTNATRSRPTDEIEITQDMIAAGEACLDALFDATVEPGSEVGLMCTPGGWAKVVFEAMWNSRHRPPQA